MRRPRPDKIRKKKPSLLCPLVAIVMYYGEGGGNQVKQYKERQSQDCEEVGLDGWVEQMHCNLVNREIFQT